MNSKLISGLFAVWLFFVFLFISVNLTKYLPLRLLTISSPSMAPKIPAGSLLFTVSQSQYSVGDIVSFHPDSASPKTITHRIIGFDRESLITAGDANDYSDNFFTPPSQIIGLVKFSFPLLGHIVTPLNTLPGFLLAIFIPTVFVLFLNAKARFVPMFPNYFPKTALAFCLFSTLLVSVDFISSYLNLHRVLLRSPVIISSVNTNVPISATPIPSAEGFADYGSIFPPAQTLRLDP